jgi:hypothetical protein
MAWRPERKRRDLALGKDAGAAIGRKREGDGAKLPHNRGHRFDQPASGLTEESGEIHMNRKEKRQPPVAGCPFALKKRNE